MLKYGLGLENIVSAVKDVLKRKGYSVSSFEFREKYFYLLSSVKGVESLPLLGKGARGVLFTSFGSFGFGFI